MQRAAITGSEAAAIFLATHGAKVNHTNKWVCVSAFIRNTLPVKCLNMHISFTLFRILVRVIETTK